MKNDSSLLTLKRINTCMFKRLLKRRGLFAPFLKIRQPSLSLVMLSMPEENITGTRNKKRTIGDLPREKIAFDSVSYRTYSVHDLPKAIHSLAQSTTMR